MVANNSSPEFNNKVLKEIQQWSDEATKIRREIHQFPERGFEESKTQKKVIQLLTEYGVDHIDTSFAKTAVVAIINGYGDKEGPSIGLRADMDALPLTETNIFDHRSQNPKVMHACGHDGHTAILLMAAKYLAKNRDFDGRAVLFFQPAEEGLGGAETMVKKERVLDKYQVDAIYAMHNWPGVPAGDFAVRVGNIMASSDRLFIDIEGKSGHAGLPHLTQDPLLVATHIYQAIQGMVARTFDPVLPVVISVTQIHGGEANNAIADSAKMSGTFRTHSNTVRDDLIRRLDSLVTNIGEAFGMKATFRLGEISHPVTVNTEKETLRAMSVAEDLVGKGRVNRQVDPMMTSEDFSYFLMEVPGCYIFLGNGDCEEHHSVGLHNTTYDFNDEVIPIGAAYLASMVYSYSNQKQ